MKITSLVPKLVRRTRSTYQLNPYGRTLDRSRAGIVGAKNNNRLRVKRVNK